MTFCRWKAKYGEPRCAEGGAVKKVVGPPARREGVRVAQEGEPVSKRRACGLMEIERASLRYQRRERNDDALRARMQELAAKRPRFGYLRLWALLRREKNPDGTPRWVVNHKRVHRLYREEGLAMRRKAQKPLRAAAQTPLELPVRANQCGRWTSPKTT